MTESFGRLDATLAGKYRIEREVGAGGMATVYIAEDLKHHRQVAVKVLRPELAASLGAERFLREIEIAAKLNHPTSHYDSGGAGTFLLCVPFVEGHSLRDRRRRAVRAARRGGADHPGSGRRLVVLASRGVVHRDTAGEHPAIQHARAGDGFGLAKAVSDAASAAH